MSTSRKKLPNPKFSLKIYWNYPIQYISYPYGSKKDYNKESIRICHESGFKMARLNYHGHVHSRTNYLELRRVLMRDWNKNKFLVHTWQKL